MLLYLLMNTRPDIAFAVSQVAHFSYSPNQSHVHAIKQIVCCLSHNWDKGMFIKPTNTLQPNCYVDADFAVLYNCDPDSSPTSAKSHLSYIISVGGVPLVCHSQLQSEISFNTLKRLSQAMHALLPICSLLIEVALAIGLQAGGTCFLPLFMQGSSRTTMEFACWL
jgi:hypothetical protein